jgi:hypothetical protein
MISRSEFCINPARKLETQLRRGDGIKLWLTRKVDEREVRYVWILNVKMHNVLREGEYDTLIFDRQRLQLSMRFIEKFSAGALRTEDGSLSATKPYFYSGFVGYYGTEIFSGGSIEFGSSSVKFCSQGNGA